MAYSYAIEQAIRASAVLHKNQVRKGSFPYPYSTHPFAVAMIISDYTEDEDTIVAALLHDTLEDTDYGEKEMQEDFGGTVKDIVKSISQPQSDEKNKLSWGDQKKQYVKQLKSASERALMVVAGDKIHNMRSVVEEYNDKHSEFTADFGGKLEERMMYYQEISNVLNRSLKNDILSEFNNVFKEYKTFIQNVEKSRNEI